LAVNSWLSIDNEFNGVEYVGNGHISPRIDYTPRHFSMWEQLSAARWV
jgi:hypothetical protein